MPVSKPIRERLPDPRGIFPPVAALEFLAISECLPPLAISGILLIDEFASMLTLLQRMILGCTLILALVLGLGLSYRNTSRRLAAANDQVQTADRALVTLEKLLSSMRLEQVLELRNSQGQQGSEAARAAQHQESQRLNSAAVSALSALDPAAAASLKAIAAQPSLNVAEADLQKLIASESSRRDAIAGPALVLREKLTRRIAYIGLATFFGMLLVAVATIFSVFRPLRRTAAKCPAYRTGRSAATHRMARTG